MDGERGLLIGEVERRTGLGKDTLRVWERRYGFPQPSRTPNAERTYPPDQVDKLLLMRALIDRGHRPARLARQPSTALRELLDVGVGDRPPHPVADFFEDLNGGEVSGLARWLTDGLLRRGLERFVLDIATPAAIAVGEGWAGGRLQIYAEHLFTEQLSRVLRMAIADLPRPAPGAAPRVLLATLPGEPHVLGLLMAEAMLALSGAACVSLGAETPPLQIAAAAAAQRSDLVALSISAASAARHVRREAADLFEGLGPGREVWVGGAGAPILRGAQVRIIADLADVPAAVDAWRLRRDPVAPTP